VRHPDRAPKNNPRLVVTNLATAPATVYRLYCQRGDVENRLKELHHGLELDRTSRSRFLANQFRVLLTLAAYILFQELRRRAAGTTCADAQVTTLRERLLKLAVWVERSVRRIVLHLPMTFPWRSTWRQMAVPSAPLHNASRALCPERDQGSGLDARWPAHDPQPSGDAAPNDFLGIVAPIGRSTTRNTLPCAARGRRVRCSCHS